MISMGVDWGKPDGDETVVTLCRAEDDGAYTIIKILRGEVAEYIAQLNADNDRLRRLLRQVELFVPHNQLNMDVIQEIKEALGGE